MHFSIIESLDIDGISTRYIVQIDDPANYNDIKITDFIGYMIIYNKYYKFIVERIYVISLYYIDKVISTFPNSSIFKKLVDSALFTHNGIEYNVSNTIFIKTSLYDHINLKKVFDHINV